MKEWDEMSEAEWDARIERVAAEPEAIELRAELERALNAYYRYFARRGCTTYFNISLGKNINPHPKGRTH